MLMKKLLSIIVLGLLLCGNVFGMSQQQAINKHLSGKKLDSLEGVWSLQQTGQLLLYFKDGNTYRFYDLSYTRYDPSRFEKSSDNYYYGKGAVYSGYDFKNPKFGNQTISINGNSAQMTLIISNQQPIRWTMQKVWPTDLVAHNSQYKTDEDIRNEEKELALIVNDAKKTCSVLGFEEGSEKFADCTLKLYTQKIDEMVAEKQARNQQLIQSQQANTTTQSSSGTNTTIIYDPVRDRQNQIDKGMKMLGGKCTLGVDC